MLPRFNSPVECQLGGLTRPEDVLPLLELERAEFEAVLGQPVHFTDQDDSTSNVWQVRIDPSVSAATLSAVLDGPALELILPSEEHFADGVNLLHSLAYAPDLTVSAELLRSRGRALLSRDDLRVVVAEEQWEETEHELSRRLAIIVKQGRISAGNHANSSRRCEHSLRTGRSKSSRARSTPSTKPPHCDASPVTPVTRPLSHSLSPLTPPS